MSLETFSKIYPANDQLTKVIEREIYIGMSPIGCLARNLALEAGGGLRELLNSIEGDSSLAFALDEKSFEGVPQWKVNDIRRHQVAVIFGVSVVEIEKTMIEGYFDLEGWCSLYNLAVAGTRASAMKVESGKSIEKLEKDHLARMRSIAREDKTLSKFFEQEGIGAVPNNLRLMFTQSHSLPIIRQEIIPLYKERARLLIPPEVAKKA